MSAGLDEKTGAALLAIARAAIGRELGLISAIPRFDLPTLNVPGASFVTLTLNGELRGCIGGLVAEEPLGKDVEAHAIAAAFNDPRFSPLGKEEFEQLRIEVSVLSASHPLPAKTEKEACARLRPGIDGVVLQCGGRRATFLPQVWEELPEPAEFLAHLKLKAGLPADYWSDTLRLSVYTVEKFREAGKT